MYLDEALWPHAQKSHECVWVSTIVFLSCDHRAAYLVHTYIVKHPVLRLGDFVVPVCLLCVFGPSQVLDDMAGLAYDKIVISMGNEVCVCHAPRLQQ